MDSIGCIYLHQHWVLLQEFSFVVFVYCVWNIRVAFIISILPLLIVHHDLMISYSILARSSFTEQFQDDKRLACWEFLAEDD